MSDARAGRSVPDISILVVSYNTAGLLERMFETIRRARADLDLEIIVVDNASHDASVETVSRCWPQAQVIENRTNVGFGRANNQAVERATGRYVLLLNTDAFVAPDTLVTTVAYMDENPQCGILGVRLTDEDGSIQPSCRFFPSPFGNFLGSMGMKPMLGARPVDDPEWNPALPRECDWVPGCYYLVRRELIEQVGLFDPRYFLYYEEVDHCRRAKAGGWQVCYYPDTSTIHLGGMSAESLGRVGEGSRQIPVLQIESELLYFRKHHGLRGATACVFFRMLTEAVDGVKSAVRRREVREAVRNARTILRAVKSTRFGAAPPR